jgi:hypothetical protein
MTSKFITLKYNFRTNSCSFLKTNRAQKKLHSVNSFIILLPVADLSFQKEINKVKLNSFGSINKSAIDTPPLLNKNDLMVKSKNSTL